MPQADDRTVNNIAEAIAASRRWNIIHNENPGFATIERPRDGLRIDIQHVAKQKTLLVKLNVDHMKIQRYRQVAVGERHYSRARATMSDVISAIERVVMGAEGEYRELVLEIKENARLQALKIEQFHAVAKAFGSEVKGPPSWKGKDDDWTPSTYIDTFGLHLQLEPSHSGKISITGFSNSIDHELLLRLIPVIKQWQKERQEVTA